MAYKPKVLTVAEGGTGAVTLTGVLSGSGTSALTGTAITQSNVLIAGASNIVSSIAPGSSGNRLISNGTDWTSAAAGGGTSQTVFNMISYNPSVSIADSTSYFMSTNSLTALFSSGCAASRIYFASACTITKCYGSISVTSLGSAENCTLAIRLNNSTNTTVSATIQLNASPVNFSNAGLSISIAAGDYIEFRFTTPALATNPSGGLFSASIFAS